tara:strand:- start:1217 stop:1450 length:234 start_codon:yes stop_codon:yes gene_type:complete
MLETDPTVAGALSLVLPVPSELALYSVIALYFVVSLTIPFWVPILKRVSGECGVFWVRAPPLPCHLLPDSTHPRSSS